MDPRAAHTQATLFAAVLDLAAHRPINDIPVTEIVALAGVNRSSFYQHFADREELLASALETLEVSATRLRQAIPLTHFDAPPTELVRFAKHFADHADLYRQALGPHGSSRVASRVRARTVQLVREGIELVGSGRTRSAPIEIEAAGTAGAIFGVVEAWLVIDPLPSHEIAAEWMWQAISPTRPE
ncbi:AcrR family transcriptional regulator [Leucobacter exalbidus]|uniref:AcrR family transcriptional regulator n=1 Tax=Leucobacter exalbidus TaxID=662960 RepID=A0A940PYW6_9MICO|nr:TetR/AcrR family transcriptional regulator [Leucobacter exalbidus]MBP1327576.1 AcrR family transcriptional regulator [Leucobacter exalbidus]